MNDEQRLREALYDVLSTTRRMTVQNVRRRLYEMTDIRLTLAGTQFLARRAGCYVRRAKDDVRWVWMPPRKRNQLAKKVWLRRT